MSFTDFGHTRENVANLRSFTLKDFDSSCLLAYFRKESTSDPYVKDILYPRIIFKDSKLFSKLRISFEINIKIFIMFFTVINFFLNCTVLKSFSILLCNLCFHGDLSSWHRAPSCQVDVYVELLNIAS